MRILVVGGLGMQGQVIARDLISQSPLYQVSIADSNKVTAATMPAGLHHVIRADLSDYDNLLELFVDYDLVVCALPADLGFGCVKAAAAAGINMVDLSFAEEDMSGLDAEAKQKGLAIITDAGVAPGLSNMVAGRAMLGKPDLVEIIVGGIPQNKNEPFGYTITWSVEDLMAEYVRPARFLEGGQIQTVPALSGVEKLGVIGFYPDEPERGEIFEIFYTDGLRSLLDNNNGVPDVVEKTLRWPGHVKAIQGPLSAGPEGLMKEMKARCRVGSPDALIMRIRADQKSAILIAHSDDKMSAMAKTTALSCATFASLLARELVSQTGILPPEKLASDDKIYMAVLDKMASHGVTFSTKYPFM